MAKYPTNEAQRVVASNTQRLDVKEKIELTGAAGKKKHWKMSLKSAAFRDHALEEGSPVIRKDAITALNPNDSDNYLMDDKTIEDLPRIDKPEDVVDGKDMASFAGLLTSGLSEPLKVLLGSGEITLAALAPITGGTMSLG